MKNELVKNAIDGLLNMFRDQKFPAEIGWQLIRRRAGDDPIPSDSWSAGNRLLAMASGRLDCRGFAQWHQAGRKIKPGSKAVYICAPIKREIQTAESAEDSDDTRTVITCFRWIPVFRDIDTSGKAIPTTDYQPQVLPPLFGVAEKLGLTVKWQPFDGRVLGRYRPGTKEVLMSEQSALTFYHEVMHHLDSQVKPIRPGRLCEAELIAEFGGSVLCAIQGITGHESSSYRYLKSYAEGKEPEAVLKSIMTIAARVDLLVGLFLDAAEAETPANSDKNNLTASISA